MNEVEKLIEAIRHLTEAVEKAKTDYAQYQRAWSEMKRVWDAATKQLQELSARLNISTFLGGVPGHTSTGVYWGEFPSKPAPPLVFRDFLRYWREGIERQLTHLHASSAACREAVPVLREVAEALAPIAAMQKLAE
jgi:hypothetical protein